MSRQNIRSGSKHRNTKISKRHGRHSKEGGREEDKEEEEEKNDGMGRALFYFIHLAPDGDCQINRKHSLRP